MVGGSRKLVGAFAVAVLLGAGATALADTKLAPPKGYRQWFHVNTAIVTKDSPVADQIGGMHNVYVNAIGLKALKSGGTFPDGSVFASDVHEFTLSDGVYSESGRKGVAVMVKAASGGGSVTRGFGPPAGLSGQRRHGRAGLLRGPRAAHAERVSDPRSAP